MSTLENDERAVFVKAQAGHLAYGVMSFVLLVEAGATALRPDLLTWNGFQAGYFIPIFAGGLVFYAFSMLKQTVGRAAAKGAAISLAIGFVVALAVALSRARLF